MSFQNYARADFSSVNLWNLKKMPLTEIMFAQVGGHSNLCWSRLGPFDGVGPG